MITIRKSGNLLEEKVDALVNTVNCVGIMGKGIALQFKRMFPDNYKSYRRACQKEEVLLGRMHIYQTGKLLGPRFIINFPTKDHWKKKSNLEDIKKGLRDLKRVIEQFNILSITIPPLGCGSGGLHWDEVGTLIRSELEPLANVHIILYEPSMPPKTILISESKPRMTPGRAALIYLLGEYVKPGYTATLLEIQKLMYFLQEVGEPLQLQYVKHKYGPYANNLNHVLEKMEGHFIRGFGDRTHFQPISLIHESVQEAADFLKDKTETVERIRKVMQIIDGFETPYGLELLASVHWIVNKEMLKTDDSIIKEVQNWNEHKKNLFSPNHIQAVIQHLRTLQAA